MSQYDLLFDDCSTVHMRTLGGSITTGLLSESQGIFNSMKITQD